jgi:hypothetical protein
VNYIIYIYLLVSGMHRNSDRFCPLASKYGFVLVFSGQKVFERIPQTLFYEVCLVFAYMFYNISAFLLTIADILAFGRQLGLLIELREPKVEL